MGCARHRLREAILDDSRCSRTFYKADRVRGLASNREAEGFMVTPQSRERRGSRYKCPRDLFRADSNSDPDRSERMLSIVKTAEDTNPCHHCGEASACERGSDPIGVSACRGADADSCDCWLTQDPLDVMSRFNFTLGSLDVSIFHQLHTSTCDN